MYKIGPNYIRIIRGNMSNLYQDFVVRLKCEHKNGMYEFVIPNNSPTVDAMEVLNMFHKVLSDSLQPKQEEAPIETTACVKSHEES